MRTENRGRSRRWLRMVGIMSRSLSSPRAVSVKRRSLLKAGAAAALWPGISIAGAPVTLGQGDFRYRQVPGWGNAGPESPVKNCHGIVCTRDGNIILLTDHTKNNFIVYSPAGKVIHKWGTAWPGAHGLSIVTEGDREVLYFTDLSRHRVFKSTLSGELLGEWGWPEQTGTYTREDEYKPSWTIHASDGSFFVLDGYGLDYIIHYGADGKFVRQFGGAGGGIVHWGPHGGMLDDRNPANPGLLIAMSDQQHLLQLGFAGEKRGLTPLPGGNPRQIRRHGRNYFIAHLGDNWPKDQNCRGFVSVLDGNLRVISNIAGTAPCYSDSGILQPMTHDQEVFNHPHDLCVDKDSCLYVAQFASGNTYPLKFERI